MNWEIKGWTWWEDKEAVLNGGLTWIDRALESGFRKGSFNAMRFKWPTYWKAMNKQSCKERDRNRIRKRTW